MIAVENGDEAKLLDRAIYILSHGCKDPYSLHAALLLVGKH
jgi:hypothetical protein